MFKKEGWRVLLILALLIVFSSSVYAAPVVPSDIGGSLAEVFTDFLNFLKGLVLGSPIGSPNWEDAA